MIDIKKLTNQKLIKLNIKSYNNFHKYNGINNKLYIYWSNIYWTSREELVERNIIKYNIEDISIIKNLLNI